MQETSSRSNDKSDDVYGGRSKPIVIDLINRRGLRPSDAISLYDTMKLREPTGADRQKMPSQKQRTRAAASGAITIPYFDSETKRELEAALRIRMADQEEPKYVGATGIPPHAYLAPWLDWSCTMKNTSVDVIFTEGEFSAAIACMFGYNCIAIAGVWSFGSKRAGYDLLPELGRFAWKGRKVIVVYDSDVAEKKGVRAALHALAAQLRKFGAVVKFKTLPSEADGGKNGIDDFLIRHGRAEFDAIEAKEFERDTIMDGMRRRYRKVDRPVGVYDCEADNGEDAGLGALLSVQDFERLTDDCGFDEPDASGKIVRRHGGKAFRESKDSPSALGIRFDPSRTVDENIFINLAKRMPDEAIQNDDIVDRYWKPLIYNVCNGDSKQTLQVEQWCAYPVRHSGAKLHHGLGIWGGQGFGKSLLGVVAGSVFAPEHFGGIDGSQLFDSFNDVLARKQLVVVNEVSRSEKKRYLTILKNMITRGYLRVNGKYDRPYTIRDTVNYILTSNDGDFLWLDDDDRRWLILHVEKAISHALGKEMALLFKGTGNLAKGEPRLEKSREARSALRYYFENDVDLSGFDPQGRAPDTEAKIELSNNTRPELDQFVRDQADMMIADAAQRKQPNELDLQTTKSLLDLYKAKFDKAETAQRLGAALRRDPRWKHLTTNTNRPRVDGELLTFVSPVYAEHWREKGPDAIRAEWLSLQMHPKFDGRHQAAEAAINRLRSVAVKIGMADQFQKLLDAVEAA